MREKREERGERREKEEREKRERREREEREKRKERHAHKSRQDRDTETNPQVVPDVVPQVHLIFRDSRVVVRTALMSQDLINVHARKVVEGSIGAVSRYLEIVPLLLRQIFHPVGQVS